MSTSALRTSSAAARFAVVTPVPLALLGVIGYGCRIWRSEPVCEPSL